LPGLVAHGGESAQFTPQELSFAVEQLHAALGGREAAE
jgi:hypothetical protein